jgi:hypothetical protein
MILILLILVLFICVFSGLALFVAKTFILGLLLPLIAVVGYFFYGAARPPDTMPRWTPNPTMA